MEVMQEQYKDTKIGRIPIDWEVVRLDEIIDFTNGKGHEKFIDENGDYIVVNSKFISQNGNVRKYSNELFSPLEKDDIAMVMSDIPNGRALAKCFLIDVNNKYTLNQRICGLRVKDLNESFPKFYYYVINRNRGYLKHNDGVGQTNLRRSEVLECLLQFPPLPEQQKIADILSTVDEQISTTQTIIDKSKELKKGLMQKLFSEGIGHIEFKDTKIGKIPKEWKLQCVDEIFHFTNGKGHEKNINEDGKYIVVNSKFVATEGRVYKSSNSLLSPLIKDDIVMVMSDVPNGRALAKCYLIDKDDKFSLNQRICGLRNKDKTKYDTKYMFYVVNRNKGYLKFNDGVGQTNLRRNEVLECLIKIPSLSEQKKIADILSEADAKIKKEEQEKAQLGQLKKGLMQQLLTGQKRVKV